MGRKPGRRTPPPPSSLLPPLTALLVGQRRVQRLALIVREEAAAGACHIERGRRGLRRGWRLSARGLGAAGLPRRARAARWLSHPGCARAWAGGGRGRRGAGVKALRRAAPLSPATRGPRRPARAPAGAHWPSRAQRGGEGPPRWCARARAGARGRARPLLLRQPARRDARSRAAAAARPREARGARARFQPRAHAPHPPISTQIRYLLLFSRRFLPILAW